MRRPRHLPRIFQYRSESAAALASSAQKQVRDDLRTLLQSHGIATREDRYRDHWMTGKLPNDASRGDRADAYAIEAKPSWVTGYSGQHRWDGEMTITADTHMGAKNALSKLERGAMPTEPARVQAIADGVRTLVHEQVHGASKAHASAYLSLIHI